MNIEDLIPDNIKKEYYESGSDKYYTLIEFANKKRFTMLKFKTPPDEFIGIFSSYEKWW